MKKRIITAVMLAVLMLLASGCSARKRLPNPPEDNVVLTEERNQDESTDNNPDAIHVEDENSEHKEYDANADAFTDENADSIILGEDKSDEFETDEEKEAEAVIADESEKVVTTEKDDLTSEEHGIDENANKTDSNILYYQTLLTELEKKLFECKKLNVYFEEKQDYLTIYKTSNEHEVILMATAYDVSSRLTAERLVVDDGWIGRKEPDVIVKVVAADILGTGVKSDSSAVKVLNELKQRDGWNLMPAVKNDRVLLLSEELFESDYGRLAAALYMVSLMYPEYVEELDADEAMKGIYKEIAGRYPEGIYSCSGR